MQRGLSSASINAASVNTAATSVRSPAAAAWRARSSASSGARLRCERLILRGCIQHLHDVLHDLVHGQKPDERMQFAIGNDVAAVAHDAAATTVHVHRRFGHAAYDGD